MIVAFMAGSGPLPSDIQPVENETLDRIITGLVTLVPFVALVFAGWQVWGSALHWSDVFLFLGIYPKPALDRIQPSVDQVLQRIERTTDYQVPDLGATGFDVIEAP